MQRSSVSAALAAAPPTVCGALTAAAAARRSTTRLPNHFFGDTRGADCRACRRPSGGVGKSATADDGEPMVSHGQALTTARIHQSSCSNWNVSYASRFGIAVASNICQILLDLYRL